MNCMAMLKPEAEGKGDGDQANPYDSGFFRGYRAVLEGAIRYRVLTIGGLTVLLAAAVIGFQRVELMFFPDSTRTQFMVDYWGPVGTPIETVSADLKRIEDHLLDNEGVYDIGTFIGSGAPRFYLPVDPELPWASFGQLVVNTKTFGDVDGLMGELRPWLEENFPGTMVRLRKYTVGPGDSWPFELRITGPADADRATLRRLGEEGMAILAASPYATDICTDMRNPVPRIDVEYDQERGRWAAVTRDNIAAATKRAYDGEIVGLYRDGDDMIPIVGRNLEDERVRAAAELDLVQVHPTLAPNSLPLGQVTRSLDLAWEDPILTRWDRHPQIALQAGSTNGTFMTLRADVIDEIEGMELPPGYAFFWDGELKNIVDGLLSLVPGMGPAALIMAIIMVALFNAMRGYSHRTGSALRDHWYHWRTPGDQHPVRLHVGARSDEPGRRDDQECHRANRRDRSKQIKRVVTLCFRDRCRRLAGASRRLGRAHNGAGRRPAASRRLLGIDGDHHHGRSGLRYADHHDSGTDLVCGTVSNSFSSRLGKLDAGAGTGRERLINEQHI